MSWPNLLAHLLVQWFHLQAWIPTLYLIWELVLMLFSSLCIMLAWYFYLAQSVLVVLEGAIPVKHSGYIALSCSLLLIEGLDLTSLSGCIRLSPWKLNSTLSIHLVDSIHSLVTSTTSSSAKSSSFHYNLEKFSLIHLSTTFESYLARFLCPGRYLWSLWSSTHVYRTIPFSSVVLTQQNMAFKHLQYEILS